MAASSLKFYPYKYLFNKINNNDNISKVARPSFAVEMSELRFNLKRSAENSLVLGDELCSGTESISALFTFSSSVLQLNKNKTDFVFPFHTYMNYVILKKLQHLIV